MDILIVFKTLDKKNQCVTITSYLQHTGHFKFIFSNL